MPTLNIRYGTKLHDRLVKKISSRIKMAQQEHEKQFDKWTEAEERTLAYLPETEVDKARNDRRKRGEPRYTTIQIPYSYGMLMSAHTYWTSVFMARSPVHQFSGRHGEGEMQIQAMEALVSYQVEVGGAMGPYFVWFYDSGKYGHGVLGSYWEVEKLHYGQLVEMNGQLFQATREAEGFKGNRVYNISPYDFIHDPRVSLRNFQQGEFCIVRCPMGWNKIIRRVEAGYFMKENVHDKLKEHTKSTPKSNTHGSDQLERPQFKTELWEDENEKHPAGAVFFEFYVDLIPSEWGVGTTNFPQKWCFTITEDLDLIVGASPLGHIHCQFPIDVLINEIEGYGLYSRGIPEIMEGVQNTVDWLINTHFFNVRASLNNQFIVDPSKLVIKDVQNSGPGFIWRLRPEAYGSDLSKMFYQVPVTDITRTHLSDFQTMLGVGERTLGINDQIMGALNSGTGRKTATEVRTTTGFGTNRLKTNTEYMSATGVAPHAQKFVQTSQQYYDASAKLRRVGSLAQDAGLGFIDVNPEAIAGFYDLVPVDGTLPIDRMAQANLWKEILGGLRMMPPEITMGYDWARVFPWVASLGGLKNLTQFRVQLVQDQQLANQAQVGNVVKMPLANQRQLPGSAAPGNAASTQSGLEAMGPENGASGGPFG